MRKFTVLFLSLSSILFFNRAEAQDYTTALGLRAAWGIGITGKHFIKDQFALEGILNYRNYGSGFLDYNFFRITALGEKHEDLSDVLTGLSWYYGAGAYLGFWGGDFAAYIDNDQTFIGIAGVVGLDLDLGSVPINVSLDWIPSINIVGGGGFGAENGGIAVRYIIQ